MFHDFKAHFQDTLFHSRIFLRRHLSRKVHFADSDNVPRLYIPTSLSFEALYSQGLWCPGSIFLGISVPSEDPFQTRLYIPRPWFFIFRTQCSKAVYFQKPMVQSALYTQDQFVTRLYIFSTLFSQDLHFQGLLSQGSIFPVHYVPKLSIFRNIRFKALYSQDPLLTIVY